MKIFEKESIYVSKNSITDEIFTDNSIFFDIETTGFSPTTASIYLIGCMHRQGEQLVVTQFFAENKKEEKAILCAFLELLSRFHKIISFNGIGFDIPFIKAKCDSYGMAEAFKDFEYIDIFKAISNVKSILKLANYKQKTIESFLGILRDDMFSGGELINVYEEYTHSQALAAEQFLLLHNYEDVIGMLELIPMLTYGQILRGAYTIQSAVITPYTSYEGIQGQELIITLDNAYSVPKRISHQYQDFYLTMSNNLTKLRIPIYEGELKYFYPDYKDYFYLPKEDIAIHKSVATFVDKQYRERAKASNCYNRKSGAFLPQITSIMNPIFKKDYKDKTTFFEVTEDFLTSDIMLKRYVEHILNHL